MTVVCILSLVTYLSREAIMSVYTNDPTVQAICIQVFLLIAVNFLFDGIQGYLQGPIRAMGLQKRASYFAIACYYIVGIPLAWFLAMKRDLGVLGLNAGFSLAVAIQAIAYGFILYKSNWQEVAD